MSVEIRVEEVTKSFPRDSDRVEVLKGVSLRILPGEFVAVVGPSGVGKSTLLHLLGALERPTSGEIWYGETALSTLSDVGVADFRNRQVGFVFQFHHLLPEFTALENVMLPLLIRRSAMAQARSQAQHLLVQVGLGERLRHRPGPARSLASLRCCWRTNRRATWTARPGERSSICCAESIGSAGLPA